jgi:hypothetical protein
MHPLNQVQNIQIISSISRVKLFIFLVNIIFVVDLIILKNKILKSLIA